jgi:hypothetical protein
VFCRGGALRRLVRRAGMVANPFFEAWATLFGVPPFDRVLPEHFPLAFDRGMAEHLAEVEAVAGALRKLVAPSELEGAVVHSAEPERQQIQGVVLPELPRPL